jgi:hypothetical protein
MQGNDRGETRLGKPREGKDMLGWAGLGRERHGVQDPAGLGNERQG